MSSDASTGRKDTREEEGSMRRLILQTGVSIDRYVAALDGSHPWREASEDEAFKRWILDSVWAAAPRPRRSGHLRHERRDSRLTAALKSRRPADRSGLTRNQRYAAARAPQRPQR